MFNTKKVSNSNHEVKFRRLVNSRKKIALCNNWAATVLFFDKKTYVISDLSKFHSSEHNAEQIKNDFHQFIARAWGKQISQALFKQMIEFLTNSCSS